MHKTDEVSEVRLVGEIDDKLHEVSEVDHDEVSGVGEAMSDDELDEDCEVHQADD